MKKLALTLIGLVALSASAQTYTNYTWTAGSSNLIYMAGLGTRLWPMTEYQSNGMVYALKSWNDQQGLTGSAKLDQKDYPAYCIWIVAQQHGDQAAAAADAANAIQAIKPQLKNASTNVLAQICALLGIPYQP